MGGDFLPLSTSGDSRGSMAHESITATSAHTFMWPSLRTSHGLSCDGGAGHWVLRGLSLLLQSFCFQIRPHLRFWANENVFEGCYLHPTRGGGQAPLSLHKGQSLGQVWPPSPRSQGGFSHTLPFLQPPLTLRSPASGGRGSGLPRLWAPELWRGATVVVSLPGHLHAGPFLRVEATEKELKTGNGQQTWGKSVRGRQVVCGQGTGCSPRVPGLVPATSPHQPGRLWARTLMLEQDLVVLVGQRMGTAYEKEGPVWTEANF